MLKKLISLALALAVLLSLAAVYAESAQEEKAVMAFDFTLKDQYGAEHSLQDYRGKVVLLNFWTTWCYWCVQEMPDLEALYHELGENSGNAVILGMGSPGIQDTEDEAGIAAFLKEKGISYPTLMDTTGEVFQKYYLQAYPTTWIINADGTILGYLEGAMDRTTMVKIINMGLEESGLPLIELAEAEE